MNMRDVDFTLCVANVRLSSGPFYIPIEIGM
jgi:hypothetical protein